MLNLLVERQIAADSSVSFHHHRCRCTGIHALMHPVYVALQYLAYNTSICVLACMGIFSPPQTTTCGERNLIFEKIYSKPKLVCVCVRKGCVSVFVDWNACIAQFMCLLRSIKELLWKCRAALDWHALAQLRHASIAQLRHAHTGYSLVHPILAFKRRGPFPHEANWPYK